MIAAFLLSTLLPQSPTDSWDWLVFPVTPHFRFLAPPTSTCHDASGRLLSAPDDPIGDKRDRSGRDWLRVTIIRTKEDGNRPITRLVRIEMTATLTTIVAVRGLRPGVNYLAAAVPIVYGDVFMAKGPDGQILPPDGTIDERDVKMVADLARIGGHHGDRYTDWEQTYHTAWLTVDLNGDWTVDDKDVALARANRGRVAHRLELVPPPRGGPKLYVATQTRPPHEPLGAPPK